MSSAKPKARTRQQARASDERLLFLLKSRGPQTSGALGEALSMTAAGAQQWLAKLARAGLVRSEDRPAGRGRPRRYWSLTEKGHGRFPDRHGDLTVELIEAARAEFGEEGVERLIARRERDGLAYYRSALEGLASLEARAEKLAELRTREGYMARIERAEDGALRLIEDHCPICAAAQRCKGFCRSELDQFRAVLGADVRREEHLLSGGRRCAYRIGAPSGDDKEVLTSKP